MLWKNDPTRMSVLICKCIKQIMTGLERNRQIFLPQEIQYPPPQEFLLTEAQPIILIGSLLVLPWL